MSDGYISVAPDSTGKRVDNSVYQRDLVDYYRQRVENHGYELAVARGLVPGATPFSAYGEKDTVGADSGVLWPNGPFVFPPASGLQMAIASTSAADSAAGTGIRSLEIHYLDNTLEERYETVVLNGTTPVNTVATNIRFVQCMHISTYGSGKAAAGNITLSSGGTTYSYIAVGGVRCSSSVRMVPVGKRLIVTSFYGGSTSGAAGAKTILRLATPSFAGHDYIQDSIFIPLATASFQDSSAGITITAPLVFSAGQAFGLIFESDKAATISGAWFGWLENA